ncbi:E3 ubiquitin-protein ligase HAKAI homolog isoform X2 [Prosopis cineraria]|uniref:E3 ubiquitin-protein ligase HAKAI homolog isoform X2 n=1 Tax=Prosopis cineraria TaxID=364024 RepID=UPI00240FA5D2|nr:E3 ubiquitin-protein ligase HAKAI homolog isoform X2 [Prosopis cineraria]
MDDWEGKWDECMLLTLFDVGLLQLTSCGFAEPCEHAFCFDCARSDLMCCLCDERIQKIQAIKMMEGIFVCAAPHCLKSFLKKTEFESHIQDNHSDLLQPNADREEGNESEAQSFRQSTASDTAVQGSQRPVFSPGSKSQLHHWKDKSRQQPMREQSPSRPIQQPKPPFF